MTELQSIEQIMESFCYVNNAIVETVLLLRIELLIDTDEHR